MTIFQFINELKHINFDETEILGFDKLVKSVLIPLNAEIETISQMPLTDREDYIIWVLWIIKFEIHNKNYEIRLSCLYEKEVSKVEYFNEDKGWKMIKMVMPEDLENPDY